MPFTSCYTGGSGVLFYLLLYYYFHYLNDMMWGGGQHNGMHDNGSIHYPADHPVYIRFYSKRGFKDQKLIQSTGREVRSPFIVCVRCTKNSLRDMERNRDRDRTKVGEKKRERGNKIIKNHLDR